MNIDEWHHRTPIGRLGKLTEIEGPAIFPASDESSYVVGHALAVDGDWLAYGYV